MCSLLCFAYCLSSYLVLKEVNTWILTCERERDSLRRRGSFLFSVFLSLVLLLGHYRHLSACSVTGKAEIWNDLVSGFWSNMFYNSICIGNPKSIAFSVLIHCFHDHRAPSATYIFPEMQASGGIKEASHKSHFGRALESADTHKQAARLSKCWTTSWHDTLAWNL